MAEPNRLTIDYPLFIMAFGRDVDYHDTCPQSAYLDLETGHILWIYDNDEDAYSCAGIPAEENAANRRMVSVNPDRYLEIPGLTHGEHHEILQEFLDSDWTDDIGLRNHAKQTYFGSIGKWMRKVDDDDAVQAYFNYRERAIESRAMEFLREHGIELSWL